ncbi:MAG TPA: hypothetical protein PKO04_11390 [Smithellaceae bacterium]|nr:hypothetical protein [Smithellaceae bacterium]
MKSIDKKQPANLKDYDGPDRVVSSREMAEILKRQPDPVAGQVKRFYKTDLKIGVIWLYDDSGRQVYEVDLDSCNDPAGVLDWIFQVTNKTWCTPEIAFAMLYAFDEAFVEAFGETVQGAICHGGKVSWREYRSKFLGVRRQTDTW